MASVLVLGAGPAAVITAILLKQLGHGVQVIGRVRRHSLIEGASQRVAQGLARVECHNALAALGSRWQRASAWNGEYREVNGEHVIDRQQVDRALIKDLLASDIAFIEGRVLHVDRVPYGWSCVAEVANGENLSFCAQFLVDARGRSAPRLQPDTFAGPIGVALTCYFHGEKIVRPLTITEPFDEGWAWATNDANENCSIQLVLDHGCLDQYRGETLEALHARICERLKTIPDHFGPLVRQGGVKARGVQPLLRGGLVDEFQLRVGDAAYSCDPLSGHGMYEAISGAFAAAPTINTLLRRRDLADLACRFYRQRAETLFHQRYNMAAEFYRLESRWEGLPFWHLRQQPAKNAGRDPSPISPRVVLAAVVEDGLIVEREVLVTTDNPRGVRFVAGVDLIKLLEAINKIPGAVSVHLLAQRLSTTPERVASALSWLHKTPGFLM